MTLPELLIAIAMMGTITAVLSSVVTVTLRQEDNTEGRLNNARSEQSVGMWLPADLASAQSIDTHPTVNLCAPTTCPPSGVVVGSNTLMLEWTSSESAGSAVIQRITRVSYVYVVTETENLLVRVHCTSAGGATWTCSQNVALHDLDGPPSGVSFEPGVTVPEWVIVVTQPLDPADTGGPTTTLPSDGSFVTKNASRVVVTVNGGGGGPGGGGGSQQISLSAGGTDRYDLDTTSLLGAPTFTAARSRCGGNIALIVDESGSIGSDAMVQVRAAISQFVATFAGTPVKLEVVRFDSLSSVLGATGWATWFDMLDEGDVAALSTAVSQLRSNGGTNWEDAWFRTFFNADGTVQTTIPDLVVFFTDGVPTYSRLNQSSASAPTDPPAAQGYPPATGSSYNQEAWIRANHIAQQFRSSVRFIGVGVGPDIVGASTWYTGAPIYERGYHDGYERYGQWYERSNKIVWQRSNKLIYEQYASGSWQSRTQAQYDATNSTRGESDGWRTRVGSGTPTWTTVATTEAQYWAGNLWAGQSDGWRTTVSSTSNVTWIEVTGAQYGDSDTTSGDSDGWRRSGSSSGWSSTSAATYAARNTTPDSSDGWRTSRVYSSPYDAWEVVSKSVYDDTPSSGRRTDAGSLAQSVANSTIITRLIAGNDFGVPAVPASGGGYTNSAEANMYVSPNWSDFAGALRSVALAECGGTLTLQTRLDGAPAPDPFTYQHTASWRQDGTPVDSNLEVVSTTRQFISGTFDFAFPEGQAVDIEIQPQNLSDLAGYQPGSWTCRAGVASRAFTTVPIPGTPWTGIKVRVAPNEAVSCVQNVTRG